MMIMNKRKKSTTAAFNSRIKQWLPHFSMVIKAIVLEGNVILNSFNIFYFS